MKASRILLASAVALATVMMSCNDHEEGPDLYRNVPIRIFWKPQFVTIDWETASPEVKSAVFNLVKGVKVINSREELALHDEFGLFNDPLSSTVWDFVSSSLVVDYLLLGGVPDNTEYNMYCEQEDNYVLNTRYSYRGGNSETAGDNVIVIGRNAVIVDKLPADAHVTSSYSVVSSDAWD